MSPTIVVLKFGTCRRLRRRRRHRRHRRRRRNRRQRRRRRRRRRRLRHCGYADISSHLLFFTWFSKRKSG